jgi:hypothetical protein
VYSRIAIPVTVDVALIAGVSGSWRRSHRGAGPEEASVPTTDLPTRGPAKPAPYVISGVLIAIGIVFPLIVPIYARSGPTLFGIPFFYWYQMLWVLIDAGLLWICFVLMIREDRRRRDAVRHDPDAATGDEARR